MTKIAALLLRNALIKIAASLMHCHAKAFLITFGCPTYNVLWALAFFNLSPCFADGTSRLRILKINCDNIKKKWSIYIMVSSMWCGFSCLKESYVYPIFIYLFCLCMWSDHLWQTVHPLIEFMVRWSYPFCYTVKRYFSCVMLDGEFSTLKWLFFSKSVSSLCLSSLIRSAFKLMSWGHFFQMTWFLSYQCNSRQHVD